MEPKAPIFTNTLILIKPTNFEFDRECAEDDKFQNEPELSPLEVDALAKEEHAGYVNKIREAGVNVHLVLQHDLKAIDAIFPDWFTIQRGNICPEGLFTIFPMCHPVRRLERNPKLISELKAECKYFIDMTNFEAKNQFLEGKGSLIYDHRNYKIYCCMSRRACEEALDFYVSEINKISKHKWTAVKFQAHDKNGDPIYHTDCMLQILENHVLLCGDTLSKGEKSKLISELIDPKKNTKPYTKIIDLSFAELSNMCCNVINVKNDKEENIILMSKRAYKGYTPEHRRLLKENYKLVYADLDTIEEVGGGSARCLMAEYF